MPTYTIKPTPRHTSGVTFNGTNDFIGCGSSTSLDNQTTYTCMAVVNVRAISASLNEIAAKYGSSGNQGPVYMELDNTGGSRIVTFWSSPFSAQLTRSNTGIIRFGYWHVIVTTRSSLGQNKIYLDGIDQTATSSTGDVEHSDAANEFQIGKIGISGGQRFFDGTIAEFAFWGSLLSLGDIQRLSRSKVRGLPLTISPATLKLYLPLDDYAPFTSGAGRYFQDLSIHRNRGLGSGSLLKSKPTFGPPLRAQISTVRKPYKRPAQAVVAGATGIMTPRSSWWGDL